MFSWLKTFLFLVCTGSGIHAAVAQETPRPPASESKTAVSKSEIRGPFTFDTSEIYPGTTRKYWIYVPAGYDSAVPACLMVVQDGLGRAKGWNLPAVMDQLIAEQAMPVTVGVFVDHGKVVADRPGMQPRFNRSFEYDSVGDRYANFLVDELLPAVARDYNLSTDPNDRSIAGASSGAIAAFNVAWERPDQFRRVLSTIGTYVGLRGGNEFPTLIRKCEPKPLRVFLQDGSGDLDIYAGDWFNANQAMLSALKFAGYEVNQAWGTGGHDAKHAAEILPEALRWLWRNHGTPIRRGEFKNTRIDLLIPDERWQQRNVAPEGSNSSPSQATDPQATVRYELQHHSRFVLAHDLDVDGNVRGSQPFGYLHLPPNDLSAGATAMTVDASGNLYVATSLGIQVLDPLGRVNVILEKPSDDPAAEIYFTGPTRQQLIYRTDRQTFGRRLKTTGVDPAAAPTAIDRPGL